MAYSWLRWAATALVAAGVTACTGETGVMLEVTRDAESTPENIDTLSFVVGVEKADGVYVRDSGSSVMDVAVAGRDLVNDPYKLLLRDGTGSGGPAEVTAAVIALAGGQPVAFGGLERPQPFVPDKVVLRRIVVSGNRGAEITETGCLRWVTRGDQIVTIGSAEDQDCDGDRADVDCDDLDPTVGPSRTEVCENGKDDNCNGETDEITDIDGDGVTNCDGDCNDNDETVHPGAKEICDGKDNDCSGHCDDGFDNDGDGYTTCGSKDIGGTCEKVEPDCNDADDEVFPGNLEVCDGKDNDCSGICDDGPFDADGDGYTTCGTLPTPDGCDAEDRFADCDDMDPEVHPGATEVCDGKDNNCDGQPAGEKPCYGQVNTGGEIVCRVGVATCDDDASDGSAGLGDCATMDNSPLVDPTLCTRYDQCKAMDHPDPFECASAMSATRKLDCTLAYRIEDLTICPEAIAPLSAATPGALCTWSLLGGMLQDHYRVGLASEPDPTLRASSPICDAFFVVADQNDPLPQRDQIYLLRHDQVNGTRSLLEVDLKPAMVTTCPEPGLLCTSMP